MKFGTFNTGDYPFKEIMREYNEKFVIKKFKNIEDEDTLTAEEKEILNKHGKKFQMFADGKAEIYADEEYQQIINGPDNATGTISKPVQVWFKYKDLLRREEEGRKKRRIENNKLPSRYYGG
jgi:uncharacterized protein YifE (UPF0438 family)